VRQLAYQSPSQQQDQQIQQMQQTQAPEHDPPSEPQQPIPPPDSHPKGPFLGTPSISIQEFDETVLDPNGCVELNAHDGKMTLYIAIKHNSQNER
jgi:hypothetical protein